MPTKITDGTMYLTDQNGNKIEFGNVVELDFGTVYEYDQNCFQNFKNQEFSISCKAKIYPQLYKYILEDELDSDKKREFNRVCNIYKRVKKSRIKEKLRKRIEKLFLKCFK